MKAPQLEEIHPLLALFRELVERQKPLWVSPLQGFEGSPQHGPLPDLGGIAYPPCWDHRRSGPR